MTDEFWMLKSTHDLVSILGRLGRPLKPLPPVNTRFPLSSQGSATDKDIQAMIRLSCPSDVKVRNWLNGKERRS